MFALFSMNRSSNKILFQALYTSLWKYLEQDCHMHKQTYGSCCRFPQPFTKQPLAFLFWVLWKHLHKHHTLPITQQSQLFILLFAKLLIPPKTFPHIFLRIKKIPFDSRKNRHFFFFEIQFAKKKTYFQFVFVDYQKEHKQSSAKKFHENVSVRSR